MGTYYQLILGLEKSENKEDAEKARILRHVLHVTQTRSNVMIMRASASEVVNALNSLYGARNKQAADGLIETIKKEAQMQ